MAAPYTSLEEARAGYHANSAYAFTGSVEQAQQFVLACMYLLADRPTAASQGGASTTFDPNMIERRMHEAQAWIAAVSGSGAARYLSIADGSWDA